MAKRQRAEFEGVKGLFWADARVPPRCTVVRGIVIDAGRPSAAEVAAERDRRAAVYAARYDHHRRNNGGVANPPSVFLAVDGIG